MASLSDVVKDIKKSKQGQKDEPTNKIIRDDWQQPPTFRIMRITWVFLIAVAVCFVLFLALLLSGRI